VSAADIADLPSCRGGSLLATYGVWIAAAGALAALPHVFSSGLALSTMSLMDS
jgi:hypothetical protein